MSIISNFPSGGGVEFPATPAAGSTIIKTVPFTRFAGNGNWGIYADILPAAFEQTCLIAGTYRLMTYVSYASGSYQMFALYKNGVKLTDSQCSFTLESSPVLGVYTHTVDIALAVGDKIKWWVSEPNTSWYYCAGLTWGVNSTDAQTEFAKYLG